MKWFSDFFRDGIRRIFQPDTQPDAPEATLTQQVQGGYFFGRDELALDQLKERLYTAETVTLTVANREAAIKLLRDFYTHFHEQGAASRIPSTEELFEQLTTFCRTQIYCSEGVYKVMINGNRVLLSNLRDGEIVEYLKETMLNHSEVVRVDAIEL